MPSYSNSREQGSTRERDSGVRGNGRSMRGGMRNMRSVIGDIGGEIKRNPQYQNIKKAASKVPDFINRYPVQSLLTGLAVGFLAAKLLTRGNSSRLSSAHDNV